MNIRVETIEDNFDKNQWNKLAAHPIQSWQWGEARKEMGLQVLRVGEFENDTLINVFQISFHRIPKINKTIAYLPMSKIPSDQVIEYLKKIGNENNAIFIKLEPNVFIDTETNLDNKSLIKSKHPTFYKWTITVGLQKTEDEILKEMKQKTRYNIRLAEKKGVNVKIVDTEEGFQEFSKLFFDTAKRQKYYGHTEKFHNIVWKHMKEDIAHIMIAYFEGKPLGAFELFYFNNILYYPYGGTSQEYRNVMAPNLLMWEAIKYGKRLNAEFFDMWGTKAPNSVEVNDGYARFKEGYGGEYKELVGSFDLPLNKFHYYLYNHIYKIRKILLKIRQKFS